MRRTTSVLLAIAVMAAMLVVFAAPALGQDRWDWDDDDFDSCWVFGFWVCDDDRDRFDLDDGFGFGDFEQEAESGDVDWSFDVSQTGDNSNQTVGTQGVANTGNTQNHIGMTDLGTFDDGNRARRWSDWWWNADDHFDNGNFEFDDVGSSIEVSPTNTTSSDQQVNQAASASK